MKLWIRALVLALLALVAAPLTAALPASAMTPLPRPMAVDDFHFESLEVEYHLGTDAEGHSTLRTIEHFVAVFPEIDQNRGIRRIIPDRFNGWPTDLEVISVTDEQLRPRPMEVEQEDGAVQITSRASSYLHGEQHYIITYDQKNVTRYFADTGVEEFYWDVNGEDWAQLFHTVEARVIIEDPALASALITENLACYVGFYGSTNTCEIALEQTAAGEPTVVTARHSDIQAKQTMTIALGFSSGTFTARADGLLNTLTGWILSILGSLGALMIALLGWLRRTVYRDAQGRGTVIPEYAPEPGLSAVFASVFVSKPQKLITAGLIDNAVQRNIQLIERSVPGFFGEKQYYGARQLEREPDLAEDREFLDGIFSKGQRIPGAEHWFEKKSDTVAGKRLLKLQTSLHKQVAARGLRNSRIRLRMMWLPFLAGLVAIALFAVSIINIEAAIAMPFAIAGLVLSVLLFLGIALVCFRSPLTREGALLKEHLEGLKLYIEVAEADRIRVLQSVTGAERADAPSHAPRIEFDAEGRPNPAQVVQLYERLLPYAVIFGLEDSWSKVLGGYYQQLDVEPYWYHGTTPFHAAALGSALSSITSTTSASFGASSSSGGSSGGGSAGGGGGGGGGGGV